MARSSCTPTLGMQRVISGSRKLLGSSMNRDSITSLLQALLPPLLLLLAPLLPLLLRPPEPASPLRPPLPPLPPALASLPPLDAEMVMRSVDTSRHFFSAASLLSVEAVTAAELQAVSSRLAGASRDLTSKPVWILRILCSGSCMSACRLQLRARCSCCQLQLASDRSSVAVIPLTVRDCSCVRCCSTASSPGCSRSTSGSDSAVRLGRLVAMSTSILSVHRSCRPSFCCCCSPGCSSCTRLLPTV
mmetsp:Transcript_28845/g.73575  ORF Transcript_28845/g.73575 Transcript_28845/m.73575 type:complete len:246 (-) Transcript_28845:470-1207(-)